MKRSYAVAFSLPNSRTLPDGQPDLRIVTCYPRGTSGRRAVQTVLVVSAILIVLAAWLLSRPAVSPVQVAELSHRAVSATAVHVVAQPGFLVITGSVRNTSGRVLSGLEAAVSLVDSAGRLLESQAAVASAASVPRDASVPFRIVTPTSAGVTAARIWFRTLDGPALP